ncbi:MAG: threonine/serine exporter family protein [Clostridia bacterium]|nr:threonine/serine exporter family protein [Clostridia bacterium]
MSEELIRLAVVLASSTVATMGIVMMFGIERRVLLWALLSSLICCGSYEITIMLGGSLLVASMIASALTAAYSDVMAHWLKVPATVMIIPGIVPLVPGGKLYYTMLGAVSSDMEMFSVYGKEALLGAAGIAIGIVAVTAVSRPLNAKIAELRERKAKN